MERDLTLQPTKCRQENLPDVHTRLSVGLATTKSPAFVSGHCCATYRQRAKRMPVDRSASSTIHDEYSFQPNVVFDGSGPFTGASGASGKWAKEVEVRLRLHRLVQAIGSDKPLTRIRLGNRNKPNRLEATEKNCAQPE